ncbi:MAG: Rrf2 family transcriptional regulator [Clostridia bacterium]|nr:Rrf2 family transcriptional regulator [Clostridia bacterium]MBR3273298.1 Rrf2 family transcriptional regulator [Clostridia bacterium]
MKISTKGRYALRMMVDIAEHQKDGYVTLKDVALRQGISKKYLEQIALHISQAGMLRAVRGYQGGYMLARPASEYSVHSILQVVEGSMAPVTCLQQAENNCERRDTCRTLPLWQGLEALIRNYLSGITLEDVVEGRIPDPGLQ